MYQKVDAPVDNTYTASAYSASTLKSWYNQSHVVGNIALSSQILFPLFITVYVCLFLFFVLELKPYKLSKKLRNGLESKDSDVRAKADSSLLTKYVASCLFHLFTLSVDVAALVHYRYLSKEIKEYYSYDPKRFWAVPIVMTIFDSITFVIFICLPPLVACCCKNWSYLLIYTLISPLSCVASHSYHIVFAFIIDPYHATSILLVYAIIAFVHILSFQKLFYYINTLISGESDIYRCCHIKNRCGRYFLTIILFIVEFILMAASIALSITLIMILPFSNAIDDAPNHLYVIYQASVAFFAALIAFQVLFRQTSSAFDVFIKAIDKHFTKAAKNKTSESSDSNHIELHNHAKDNTKFWMELSETEKEQLLAKVVMSHLNKDICFHAADEIKFVFQQKESSPQPNTGGCQECFSQCCRKKESDSSSNAGGCFSRCSNKKRKQQDNSDGDSSRSNTGGCFSCCYKCRKEESQSSDSSPVKPNGSGHSSESSQVKTKEQQQEDSNNESCQSDRGGCFLCCCQSRTRKLQRDGALSRTKLLVEEETQEP